MKNKRAIVIAIAVVVAIALATVVAVMSFGHNSQQKPADNPVVEASDAGQSSTPGELPIVSDSPEETSVITVDPSNSESATPGASGGSATDESTASADSSGKSDENSNANAGSNSNGGSNVPSGSNTPSEGKLSPHETPILEL